MKFSVSGGRHAAARLLAGALLVIPFAPVPAETQDAFAAPGEPQRLRAVRATGPVVVDGRLDEPYWALAPVAHGFRQANPDQGEPARLASEVRVLFDDQYLYVGAWNPDPMGEAGLRVPDLRRDFNLLTHDQFGVVIDALGDGRHAMVFGANPLGAQRDKQVTDGTQIDLEWNGLWHVRTERTDSGWSVEMAIPWSTLRYTGRPARAVPVRAGVGSGGSRDAAERGDTGELSPPAGAWRINFFRMAQRLGESSGWAPWPRAYSPYHLEYAGRLVGIEPPVPSRNLRVQPYLVARGERVAGPAAGASLRPVERSLEPAAGGDAKWVIDPTTVLDLTVNTDFAEADVDRQVVNLSRFSVLFPEQRPFFLENRGVFTAASSPTVQPFFTRRIGLDPAGLPIPLHVGGRFTRRTSERSLGALLVRQGAGPTAESSTFGVGRVQQNVGRQSRVGAMAVTRWDQGLPGSADARNLTLALDAAMILTPALRSNLMISRSLSDGMGGDGLAATAWVGHTSNLGYFGWLQHYIGADYNPAAGFVYGRDLITTSPAYSLDLRPSWRPAAIRNFRVGATVYAYHRASDLKFQEANVNLALLGADFRNTGFAVLRLIPEWQHLERPFAPLAGARIAPGDYQFTRLGLDLATDQSARYNGQVELRTGSFYDGRMHQLTGSVMASPIPHASFTASYSANVMRGVGEDDLHRTTHLLAPGLRLALNPRAQLAGFYQYNTAQHQGSGNVRASWEFRPLSYLHVVYNDRAGLDPATGRWSSALPTERQLIVKLTYLGQL